LQLVYEINTLATVVELTPAFWGRTVNSLKWKEYDIVSGPNIETLSTSRYIYVPNLGWMWLPATWMEPVSYYTYICCNSSTP